MKAERERNVLEMAKALRGAHDALTRFWATSKSKRYYKPQYVRDAVVAIEAALKNPIE